MASLYKPHESTKSITYRPLQLNDKNAVRSLFQECFPLHYPDSMYSDIVTNKYTSIAAVGNNKIVGVIICDIRQYSKLPNDEYGFLHRSHYYSSVVYILNLCVSAIHRKKGIASVLLQKITQYITITAELSNSKAIFLHVMAGNEIAIKFYVKHKFEQFRTVRNFYLVKNKYEDAYLYVLYVNEGTKPIPNEFSRIKSVVSCTIFIAFTLYVCYFVKTLFAQ